MMEYVGPADDDHGHGHGHGDERTFNLSTSIARAESGVKTDFDFSFRSISDIILPDGHHQQEDYEPKTFADYIKPEYYYR